MNRHLVLVVCTALLAGACGGDTSSSDPSTGPDTTSSPTVAPATTDPATTDPATTVPVGTVEAAAVERAADGALVLRWEGEGPVVVRTGTDGTEFPETVATAAEGGVLDLGVPDRRVYVRVEPVGGGDGLTVAERRVPMEGVPNFRDLGGYETEDGRHVRWGQVFRSGALGDLTDADLETAGALGIRLVCDLRSDGEVADKPDPDIGAASERFDVVDEAVDVQALTDQILRGDLSGLSPDLLLDGMPRIATEFDDLWSDVLRRIADPENRPTNVHCSAGKDRAGWASALVLRTLGVPEETVMEDYLLSNEYLAEYNAERLAQVRTLVAGINGVPEEDVDLTNLEAVLGVRAEYLQAAFDAVDAQYGSFDAYLTDGLGLTEAEIAAFRDSLLE